MNREERLEELRRIAQEATVEIAESFTAPDDDFAPVLLIASGNRTTIFPLPVNGLENDASKEATAKLIRLALLALQADASALVVSTFVTRTSGEDWRRILAFREQHGRDPETYDEVEIASPGSSLSAVEELTLILADDIQNELWEARIDRDGDRPPKLGDWEIVSKGTYGDGVAGGRFFDAMVEPLREIADGADG